MGRRGLIVLLAAGALFASCSSDDARRSEDVRPTTAPLPSTTTPAPPPPPATQPSPPARPFSWQSAGALVWHETDVDPTILGQALRANGFGWAAVLLHDGLAEDAIDPVWIKRFTEASGLPLGGWGVLRSEPEREAELASALLARSGLRFYVANAEREYEFSGEGGPSHERSGRSRRFVTAFRALHPALPAGVSSYCRPDQHDIDWASWRDGGFVFLPQAYVNAHGPKVAPLACVRGAAGIFPPGSVHPTLGVFRAPRSVSVRMYASLLAAAGTRGFSVYPAEVVAAEQWQALGRSIAERRLAG
ncbi:MAG: hypothetical protein M3321_07795 [Actinomycetota bacterium]|nr:hypothetical protein [Actinomycetota bacterium]